MDNVEIKVELEVYIVFLFTCLFISMVGSLRASSFVRLEEPNSNFRNPASKYAK